MRTKIRSVQSRLAVSDAAATRRTRAGRSEVEQCLAAVRWQGSDSSRAAAAEAINAALAAALPTRAPLLVYQLTRRAQKWLYLRVADNRYQLPSTTPWYERYPADCNERSHSSQTDSKDCC